MASKEQIEYAKKVRKQMAESTDAVEAIIQYNLAKISEQIIDDIIKAKKKLKDGEEYKATSDIKVKVLSEYYSQLNDTLAETVEIAWSNVAEFVGFKKKITFAETFDKLPKKVRERLKKSTDLLIGTSVADLEKSLYFAYDEAILRGYTIDKEVISRLEDSAEKFYTGSSISAGSSKVATQYINNAVNSYYALDEVKDELDALLFYNPDPKTPICVELNGRYFSVSDPNLDTYIAPLHFGCKSTMLPTLKGNLPKSAEVEKLNPSDKARESIQFSCTCHTDNFLKRGLNE